MRKEAGKSERGREGPLRRRVRAVPRNRKGSEEVGMGYFRGRRHRFPQLMVVFIEIARGK